MSEANLRWRTMFCNDKPGSSPAHLKLSLLFEKEKKKKNMSSLNYRELVEAGGERKWGGGLFLQKKP